eukprot:2213589-Amphidinium_carterae.1
MGPSSLNTYKDNVKGVIDHSSESSHTSIHVVDSSIPTEANALLDQKKGERYRQPTINSIFGNFVRVCECVCVHALKQTTILELLALSFLACTRLPLHRKDFGQERICSS